MYNYRVSYSWSTNMERRKEFILNRLKDRIRARALKEEVLLSRNKDAGSE